MGRAPLLCQQPAPDARRMRHQVALHRQTASVTFAPATAALAVLARFLHSMFGPRSARPPGDMRTRSAWESSGGGRLLIFSCATLRTRSQRISVPGEENLDVVEVPSAIVDPSSSPAPSRPAAFMAARPTAGSPASQASARRWAGRAEPFEPAPARAARRNADDHDHREKGVLFMAGAV